MTVTLRNAFRLPLAGVALAGLGLSLAALPARAQDSTYDGGAYSRDYGRDDDRTAYDQAGYGRTAYNRGGDDEEITVYGPRYRGRSSTTGAPIREVRSSRLVSFRDLDIYSDWGARELHLRIERAAHDACSELDDRYPIGEPDVGDCVSEAVRNAEHQLPSDRDGW
jgi:UrcA family protein